MIAHWGVHLLHATWQSAVVALIALAVTRSFARISSHVRYAILGIAMMKFALPPMLPLRIGIFSAMPPVGSQFFRPAERVFATGSPSILQTLFAIQVVGSVVVLSLIVGRAFRLGMLIRGASLTPRGTTISDRTAVPFVYGFFNPTVVLPKREWQGRELADVLAHESMHVALHDSRHAALQSLLAIVWWWNPLFWLLSSEVRRVREERCDDAVLAAGLSSARRYSRTIVDLATSSPALSSVAMAAHPLESRLRRLADARIRRSVRMRRAEVAIVIVTALVVLPGLGPGVANPRAGVHAVVNER